MTVDGTMSISHTDPSYCSSSLPLDDDRVTGVRLPGPLLPVQLPMVAGLALRVRGRHVAAGSDLTGHGRGKHDFGDGDWVHLQFFSGCDGS